mmetsp:Transcript_11970/g.18083  ORF Transcript_11970/g.18083 Transcript_11970/m.18083 type:complete len:338 (-) Transcript_11970:898-1911(-)
MTKTTGTTDSVEISFRVFWKIKVHHDIDRRDINTAGKKVRRDEIATSAVAEIVKDPVAVRLRHFCVDVEARVAHFGNFFGEELDTINRVAKHDRLFDAEFGKEGVKTVNLLLFFDKRIVLGDTFEGELLHEINFIRLDEIAVLKVFDSNRKGGRKQQDLTVLWQIGGNIFDDGLEFRREQLVCLVHDEHVGFVEMRDTLVGQIENSPRGSHQDVNSMIQAHDVVFERCATSRDHHLHAQMLAKLFAHLARLQCEFSRWDKNQHLDVVERRVNFFECRNGKCCRFASTIFGTCENITSCQRDRNRLFLDWRWCFVALFKNAHQQLALQVVIFKLVALC